MIYGEVNLLSHEKLGALRRAYYLNLATLTLALIAVVLVVGGALLIPSYIAADRSAREGERFLAALEETAALRERSGVTEEMRALAERVKVLEVEAERPSYVSLFEGVFQGKTSAIKVSGISFIKGDDALQVSIKGSADTRAALIGFSNYLKESGSFEGVSVPVSQLATDQNIPFSITATYRSSP